MLRRLPGVESQFTFHFGSLAAGDFWAGQSAQVQPVPTTLNTLILSLGFSHSEEGTASIAWARAGC